MTSTRQIEPYECAICEDENDDEDNGCIWIHEEQKDNEDEDHKAGIDW